MRREVVSKMLTPEENKKLEKLTETYNEAMEWLVILEQIDSNEE